MEVALRRLLLTFDDAQYTSSSSSSIVIPKTTDPCIPIYVHAIASVKCKHTKEMLICDGGTLYNVHAYNWM